MSSSTRTRPRRTVRLQPRDLAVLELLVERRSETLDWLHKRVFDGVARKRARNRLGELCGAGYLERLEAEVIDQAGLASVYRLGPRGVAVVKERCLAAEHLRYRRWNPILRERSIPHQIATNRVGDWLRIDMVPEHLLSASSRQEVRQRPDAAYPAAQPDRDGARLVFVEVDLGHYSRRRLVEKMEAWYQHKESVALLFVCYADRKRFIEGLAKETLSHFAVHVVSLEELVSGVELPPAVRPRRTDDGQSVDPFAYV